MYSATQLTTRKIPEFVQRSHSLLPNVSFVLLNNHQAHTKIKNRNYPIKNDTSTKQIWQHLYFITSFFESSCQTSQYHDPMTAGEKITGIFLKKISTLLDLKNLLKFFRWLPLESHRWADLSCY